MHCFKRLITLTTVLFVAAAANARTKEVAIAGGEKVKIELTRGMPEPARKDGIKIEAAAFGTGDDGLAYGFAFTASKASTVTHVKVENVTGPTADVLVDDAAPEFKKDEWFNKAKPLPITPEAVPWLFAPGDTMLVFRFTVTRGEKSTVLYQAAVFSAETKAMVIRAAAPRK